MINNHTDSFRASRQTRLYSRFGSVQSDLTEFGRPQAPSVRSHAATALSCVLVLAALLACKSDVTATPPGSYGLDVSATKAQWEKQIAALPEDQKALRRMSMGLLPSMTVDLTLADGGALTGSMSIRLDDIPPEPKPIAGTWSLAGTTVTLTFTQPKPEVNTCQLVGGSLECTDETGGMMVYSRK